MTNRHALLLPLLIRGTFSLWVAACTETDDGVSDGAVAGEGTRAHAPAEVGSAATDTSPVSIGDVARTGTGGAGGAGMTPVDAGLPVEARTSPDQAPDAARSPALDGDRMEVGNGTCTTLRAAEHEIDVPHVMGPCLTPTLAGGELSDGTYVQTSASICMGLTPSRSRWRAFRLRISNQGKTAEWASGAAAYKADVAVSGDSLTMTERCRESEAAMPGQHRNRYSASADQIILFDNLSLSVYRRE